MYKYIMAGNDENCLQKSQRFNDTYFSSFKGKYFTGDGCKRDDDGYYWITGRVDDVINVSGHRLELLKLKAR